MSTKEPAVRAAIDHGYNTVSPLQYTSAKQTIVGSPYDLNHELELGERPSRIGAFCENVNGAEDNCDRLNLYCPKGLKPNFDYVTCERIPTTAENVFLKWNGVWKFPDGTVNNEGNPAKCFKPVIKLCEDLNGDLFDETVDVSFLFLK